MAPEQAKGKAVDKRADIWAFGVVLYEMLTGRRAFDAETPSEVVAAILTREPDWRALPEGTPPAVRRLLARCLDRDPKNRLHDIGEARVVLDNPAAWTDGQELPQQPRRALLPWFAALVLATAGAASIGYFAGSRAAAPREAQHLAIQLSAQQEIGEQAVVLAFSPDDGTVVFRGWDHGRQYLLRRNLRDREATAIPGSDDGGAPFFSPDGRWIGFHVRRQLMKLPAEGGRPFPIAQGALGAV